MNEFKGLDFGIPKRDKSFFINGFPPAKAGLRSTGSRTVFVSSTTRTLAPGAVPDTLGLLEVTTVLKWETELGVREQSDSSQS